MTPTALTIAGSDSGGGAGIQADLKTFSALGVYGASVITAITAQNTRAVIAVQEVSDHLVAAQIDAVLEDLEVHAIKIGMLFSPSVIHTTAVRLTDCAIPVVLDPVMVAKSGDVLLQDDAIAVLIDKLVPIATLLTPNLPEAARLLGEAPARTVQEMEVQGRRILGMGPSAVLMKGGHGSGDVCTDVLLTDLGAPPLHLDAPRIGTRNTHGTGCTLSSAVAAELAKGRALQEAVRTAHGWLQAAIRAADGLRIGTGHGPVHHFHALWAHR